MMVTLTSSASQMTSVFGAMSHLIEWCWIEGVKWCQDDQSSMVGQNNQDLSW